jgi:hypothetical protein
VQVFFSSILRRFPKPLPLPWREIRGAVEYCTVNDPGPMLLLILVVAVVLAVALLNYYAAQKRREELFALANELGLEFYHFDPFHLEQVYASFDCMSRGHSRKACNVMRGRLKDYEVTAFDFIYYTTQSNGKTTRQQKHQLSVVAVDTTVFFKPLLIRPEGLFDRVAGMVGFDDIDFESSEFSRMFYVASPDKKFAYDVIHQRMMQFLMTNPGWSLQMVGRTVIVYNGNTFAADDFRRAIDFVYGFFGQYPDYLWQDLNAGRRPDNGQ